MDFVHHHKQGQISSRDCIAAIPSKEAVASAKEHFARAKHALPWLHRYEKTPVTPPEFFGYSTLAEYAIDAFAVIDDMLLGTTLSQCFDITEDHVLRLALLDAEEAVRKFPDVFRAFVLLHVLAFPDHILLVATPGSVGEREGFVASSKRKEPHSTTPEIVRFDKLRRANLAKDIVATFDDADRAIISPKYAKEREEIVQFFGLELAYVKFITELSWSHSDVKTLFEIPGNASAYTIFPARAGKAGINVDRYLDALLAIALLAFDLTRYRTASENSLPVFRRLAQSEYEVAPERHGAREARERHAKKLRVKEVLKGSGLDPQDVFIRLGTPLGGERGEVIERIYAVIRGESDANSFGVHAKYIEEAARQARERLAAESLFV